ncbi:MAG: ParB/RepB/Spo0J family partition protein, partial [Balneolaceae bacterium]|nr:ParB/RepB/Spo0J family partition protein [Balneolaceae bacterium]
MSSRKALGRGLGAFFPDYEGEGKDAPEGEGRNPAADPKARVNVVLHVPVQNIRPNPHQPRKEFREESLRELAHSIESHGLIQPITVRYLGEKRFELISGERRLRASKQAGLREIPAYVREVEDDQILSFALIENIQREDLNPIEIAVGYQRLVEEAGLTQAEVAEKVGKNRSTVANMLRLLNLPAFVQAALR